MNRSYSIEEKQAIINRYLNGENISELSSKTGIARGTIYSWINNQSHIIENRKGVNLRDLHFATQKCIQQQKIIEILQHSPCSTTAPLAEKYAVITQLSDTYNINTLCDALKVAKGSYYNHVLRNKNENTVFAMKHSEMTPIIESIFNENHQIFGAGKIHAILKDRGYAISEKTVAKIMHENGWFSVRSSSKTLYKQAQERRINILQQEFHVSRPNEVWVSDVTYFFLNGMKLYTCVIIDLFARKVIAYKISRNNSTQLTMSTLRAAYKMRHPTTNSLLFHSDQGANYTSERFRNHLNSLGITQSFSNPGMPYDNSVMESFFGGLKREELYRNNYKSEREFRESIAKYMDFYNIKRPHSVLMNHTPAQFEAEYLKNHNDSAQDKLYTGGSDDAR